MAGGEHIPTTFHQYSSLPAELQLDVVRKALCCNREERYFDNSNYAQLSCLGRIWQQVVEGLLFYELTIEEADLAAFEQICVGRRRSFLKRLIFLVDVSKELDRNVNTEQQHQLPSVQDRERFIACASGPTRPPSSPTSGGPVAKKSASEVVTVAYRKLFRLLATWSFTTDHAELAFVYIFEGKGTDNAEDINFDEIRVDIEDIPPVTVIKEFACPEYTCPDYTFRPRESKIDWYIPSYLGLLTLMHGLERWDMTRLFQVDRPSTMQASESAMRELLRTHEITQTQIKEFFAFDDDDTMRLCDAPPESAAALRSLTLVIFDFSHRLERLSVFDAIFSAEFFRAALSSPHHTAWPNLRDLHISDSVACDCILTTDWSPTPCAAAPDLVPIVTRSLDHMPRLKSLEVHSYCSRSKETSQLELKVLEDSDSILLLIGFTMTEEYISIWESAVERLGGNSMKVDRLPM